MFGPLILRVVKKDGTNNTDWVLLQNLPAQLGSIEDQAGGVAKTGQMACIVAPNVSK